ncbi:MAG TPA: amidohydrolase family protein, partial [Ktedonobacteraceae bacterium]|nr:amidohydrolase family protein [Ktedonobacteraceae bacterium]
MSTVLYLNGNIYTLDAQQPRAQALAIDQRSGEILAVGSNDEVRKSGGHNAELVDLRGKTVIPGMIDAHMHLVGESYRAYNIEASACHSEDEVAELVRQRAAQTPGGQWIRGGQWYKEGWANQHFPSRASLDAVAPHHPVALWSKDGHLLWANSLALQKAGITSETPDPAGGAILRDGAGEPTGILQEGPATSLVTRLLGHSDPKLTRQLVKETL